MIKGGVRYRESLNPTGYSVASHASIELHNEDGSLDSWHGDVWKNREIRIYYGDVTWSRDDYRLVAKGVVDRAQQSRDTFVVTLVDPLERLDNAVTEQLLGGPGQEADRLIPVPLGENHNITPRLYNAAVHEYRFSATAFERIIEVRDRGVPVEFTQVPGGFRLTAEPDGIVTASIQGDATGGYENTVATLVRRLATSYGPVSGRFTTADLDLDNLASFDAANQQPVGLYLEEHNTVLSCIVELASSIGAQAVMSRTGQLRLLKIDLPAPGVPVTITPNDYEEGSLDLAGTTEVIAGVRLGYCRQWTPRQNIAEGVPSEHQDLYAQEWLTVTAKASAVATEYRISTETEQINTLMLRKVDAQLEASRRLSLWSTPRFIVRVRGMAQLLDLELGQTANIYGDRFGLELGRIGQIIGLDVDWVSGRCDVEVLI